MENGKYWLQKGKETVGEAVVMSPVNVNYHLFKNIRETQYGTVEKLKRKFKFVSQEEKSMDGQDLRK